MEENKKKVSSREAWRLHRRAAKLFYAERPALHAVNWLYAAFKSLSPYVLIYLSAQIIGELTGARDAHRLTVLAIAAVAAAALLPLITAALERRQTVLYDNSFYINQKIYANKLLDMDFPRLDDPKTHDDLSQILQNENWSGYGLGACARCGDEAADVRFWCSGRCRPHRDALHAARARRAPGRGRC